MGRGLGEEQGMGLVEGLVSVAVLDPGHCGSPTQGCPFPAGTCCYKPPETEFPAGTCHYKPPETIAVVGAGGSAAA